MAAQGEEDPTARGEDADGGEQAAEVDPTGRFLRFDAILGKGCTKTVYKGFDREQGIEVAWNQVKLPDTVKQVAKTRLFSEISVLRKLKHRNIMKFYTSWLDNRQRTLNFITEYFHSGTLRRHRMLHKCVTLQVLKRWAWQILQGLVYLHGHDPPIVHRDLKCDNIFIHGVTGEVKIGDLGMAKLLTAGLSKAQSVLGTPEYMAPELYDERYNEKIDIYAYGMCLMELVTMEFPYMECDNRCQIFRKVTLGVYPAALARIEETEVRDFIELCISHDHRYRPSARELLKNPFFDSLRAQGMGTRLGQSFSGPSMVCPAVIALPGARTFSLRVTEAQGRVLKFKLGIKAAEGAVQCFAFPFDVLLDTVEAVAGEMETDFELTSAEADIFKLLLQEEVTKARALGPLERKLSGLLSPILATGTSSEMTASFEGTFSDSNLAMSASEPYMSAETVQPEVLCVQELAKDSFVSEETEDLDCMGDRGQSDNLGVRGRSSEVEQRMCARPWALEDTVGESGLIARLVSSGDSPKGVRVHSLMRKQCASEPCLVLSDLCEDSSAVKADALRTLTPRIDVNKAAAVAGGPGRERKAFDPRSSSSGSALPLHPASGAGAVAETAPVAEVVHNTACVPEVGGAERGPTGACAQMASHIGDSTTGASDAGKSKRKPLLSKSGGCPRPTGKLASRSSMYSQALQEHARQALRSSMQSVAGMIGGLTRRRSWSASVWAQQDESNTEAACQWSQQEIKPRDVLASRKSGEVQSEAVLQAKRHMMCLPVGGRRHGHGKRRGGQRFRSSGALEALRVHNLRVAAQGGMQDAPDGSDSPIHKYASVLQSVSSSDRLSAKSMNSGRRPSMKEIRWHRSKLSPNDVAGLDNAERLARSASVPVEPQSCSRPQAKTLASRYSSPCASSSRDRGFWKTLVAKVAMRRKATAQNNDSAQSQIFDPQSAIRRSLGPCIPVRRPRDSPPILSHLAAM
eukprot:evm.model.scf_1706.3 EVM.evm.TU.scf_1706.3   scf_1706:24551-29573(-)